VGETFRAAAADAPTAGDGDDGKFGVPRFEEGDEKGNEVVNNIVGEEDWVSANGDKGEDAEEGVEDVRREDPEPELEPEPPKVAETLNCRRLVVEGAAAVVVVAVAAVV